MNPSAAGCVVEGRTQGPQHRIIAAFSAATDGPMLNARLSAAYEKTAATSLGFLAPLCALTISGKTAPQSSPLCIAMLEDEEPSANWV